MSIRELIEELSKLNPDGKVMVWNCKRDMPTSSVELKVDSEGSVLIVDGLGQPEVADEPT